MDSPHYSAYVPVYNQAATLGASLASIKAQSIPPAEILVVDDGSTDDSVKIAEAMGVTVLRQNGNLGRGAARARAITEAKHEWVLGCDAGNRLPPDFAAQAFKHFKNAPSLAAVHGWFLQSNSGNVVQRWRSRHLFARPVESLQRNAVHVTAGCMVRRSAILAVGNYSPARRAGEDAELGRRLQASGWEVWLDPNLGIDCLTADTRATVFERYARWNETDAPKPEASMWRDYAKRCAYAIKVLAMRDIRAGDWAALPLSLALPHVLARRARKRKREMSCQRNRTIHFVNIYGEPWLDRCMQREAVSRAHLWGIDALAQAGFTVNIIRSRRPTLPLRFARWLTRITGGRIGYLAADLLVLWQARRDDLVYIAAGQLLLTPLAVRCGLRRLRLIAWIYKPSPPFSWRTLRGLDATHFIRSGYTGWLALTPHVEAWLHREHPTARIRRVVWASDTDYYPPAHGAGTYFAATGVTQRDYTVLLDAAKQVNFPFVILGPDALQSQASANVTWRGRKANEPHATIDDQQLRELYHGARAILIPLKPDPDDASGFTNLLEAIACGRPVVMTRTGALDLTPAVLGLGFDIAPSNTAGWVKALQSLAQNPSMAEKFAARSAELAREYFNLPRFEKDLVAYFVALVENLPEPAPVNIVDQLTSVNSTTS